MRGIVRLGRVRLGLLVGLTVLAVIVTTAAARPPTQSGFSLRQRSHDSWLPRLSGPFAASVRVAASGAAKGSGSGKTLCVGGKPSCYATIQAALDAAHDGDTVRVAAGTFAGGVTIAKSLSLVGAGVGATVISGGGPVLTIGTFYALTEPTVSISRVTITGGLTTSSALSNAFVGADNVIALGGGIEVPPAADVNDPNNLLAGATLSITDSVITGNRVAPTVTLPFGPPCPSGPCPFAWAKGGGIDSWGALTLKNTAVTNNEASGVASDADGGGIDLWSTASLTMTGSTVSGNRALAAVPNGRYAEGGGIFGDQFISVKISGGSVSGNTASLVSVLPFDVGGGNTLDMNANGGGIHIGDGSTVEIRGTALDGNTVVANDPNGEPYGFDSALHPGDAPLVLRDSSITGNKVIVTVASSADVGPSGSAVDLYGAVTVSNTRISRNSTLVTSAGGTAWASAAVYSGDPQPQPALILDSVIRDNTVTAAGGTGAATIFGAGLVNEGLLTLRDDHVGNNRGIAIGTSGYAQGGGIWNSLIGNPVNPQLTLEDTSVTGNTLTASTGVLIQGGGIFTTFPVTLTNSRIAGNSPDQCYGC